MNNWNNSIPGMEALPPNPRDLSLLRQDSWTETSSCARHLGIPAAESALGLHFRSALSPLRSAQFIREEKLENTGRRLDKTINRPSATVSG